MYRKQEPESVSCCRCGKSLESQQRTVSSSDIFRSMFLKDSVNCYV